MKLSRWPINDQHSGIQQCPPVPEGGDFLLAHRPINTASKPAQSSSSLTRPIQSLIHSESQVIHFNTAITMTLAKYMIFALLVCAAVSSPVYDAVDVNDNSEAAEGEDLLERLASHLQQRIARGSSSGAGGATVAASGNDASANVAANSQSEGGPYYNGNSGSGSGTASGTGNSISGAAAGTGTAAGSGNVASATGGAYGTAAGRDGYLNLQGNGYAATGTGGYYAQSGASGNGGGGGRRGSASITSGANTNGGRVRGGRSIAV